MEGTNRFYFTDISNRFSLRKCNTPNTKQSIIRPSGTLYKFQGLLHHSFNRYCITTKLFFLKRRMFS